MNPARPPAVRIDDLEAPRFSPAARAILDALDDYGSGLELDPGRLCDAASEQTGLDGWGDAAFRSRLDLLCRALRAEADLARYGVALTWESLLQALRNRLLVEDLVARHPEIAHVPIERPIIICGLPRTGTTHLHNLLSADPALRHLPYWESLEPVLPAAEAGPEPATVGAAQAAGSTGRVGAVPDPRLGRCQAAVDLVDTCMPLFKRMHEMTVEHAHEEIQLLAIDMSGMLFETTDLLPSWRDYYRATDQTPSYGYLRRVLQVLTWLRGGRRWVLKSPQHLEQFRPLLATFPDATFVVTHRDPVAVTASTCTMLAYTARLRTAHPDVRAIGAYWADRTADLLQACLADHDLLPRDQTVDVALDDFMADELGTVEHIYGVAGQPLDDAARAGMAAFVETHPRGRHGTVAYDLTSLGLDADSLRTRLGGYSDRFGLRDEGLH